MLRDEYDRFAYEQGFKSGTIGTPAPIKGCADRYYIRGWNAAQTGTANY